MLPLPPLQTMLPVYCWLAYVPTVYLSYRLIRTALALLWAFLLYKVVPQFYKPALQKYKTRWTVVSGGTDGIGKAYMFELAKSGLRKFVIIGRNQKKLDTVKEELETRYHCQVEDFLFDFLDGDYKALRRYLSTINIGFVVNSVGVGREYLERYGDNPDADQKMLKFMSCVLGPMEENGGGQMVVLSSTQGIRPIPLLAAYSSTKALISFLCSCIDREYKSIRVQCLMPALVATNMTYYSKGSLFVVTPQQFAREALSTLGIASFTSGCFNHELQCLIQHLFPWTLLKYMMLPIYWRQQKRMIQLHGEPSKPRNLQPATDLNPDLQKLKSGSGIPRKISRSSLDESRMRA